MRGFQARQLKSAQSKDKYFLEFLRFFKRVRQYRFNSLHVFDIRFKCKFRSLSNDIPANLKANFQRKEINISLTGAQRSTQPTQDETKARTKCRAKSVPTRGWAFVVSYFLSQVLCYCSEHG